MIEQDEKKAQCESDVVKHVRRESALERERQENESKSSERESDIATAENTIEKSKTTIATNEEAIRDTKNALLNNIEAMKKLQAETADANEIFTNVLEMLSASTGATVETVETDDDETTAEAAYESAAMSEGTSKIIKIIETIQKKMNEATADSVAEDESQQKDYRNTIQELNDDISKAEGQMGEAQTSKADNEAQLAGLKKRMEFLAESLQAEAAWWGEGHQATPGQDCLAYLGLQEELATREKRDAQVDNVAALSPEAGKEGGIYHTKNEASKNEMAGLKALKTKMKEIQDGYVPK